MGLERDEEARRMILLYRDCDSVVLMGPSHSSPQQENFVQFSCFTRIVGGTL